MSLQWSFESIPAIPANSCQIMRQECKTEGNITGGIPAAVVYLLRAAGIKTGFFAAGMKTVEMGYFFPIPAGCIQKLAGINRAIICNKVG